MSAASHSQAMFFQARAGVQLANAGLQKTLQRARPLFVGKRMKGMAGLAEDNLDYVKATNYALHITIKDEGGKAVVDLKGAFYRAFPLNDPPADQNDEASTAAVEALHQSMIDALVARFGAGG